MSNRLRGAPEPAATGIGEPPRGYPAEGRAGVPSKARANKDRHNYLL